MTNSKIEINNKIYNIQIVETEEEAEKGLMGVTSLPEDSGMLFPYEEEDEVAFWMKDTLIPLDIIFIDEDGNVTKIVQGIPNDETQIIGEAQYILELNVDSGVKLGDQVFFDDEDDDEDNVELKQMYIIGSDGEPQATIEGGERIFSRKNTITLIRMAKRAFKYKSDSNFRSLGKKAFKYLDIQDNNEAEFVSLPD